MEFKKIIKQYRNMIILAGLAIGLIFGLDATKVYEIGISEFSWYVKYGGMVIIAFTGYVYYEVFMNMPKRRIHMNTTEKQKEYESRYRMEHQNTQSQTYTQHQQIPPAQPIQKPLRKLEDINPPEMR